MLSAAVASILPHLPMTGKSRQSPGVHPLPSAGLGRFALSIQAWYTYLQGDYNKRIGIVETAFAIQAQLHSIPNLFSSRNGFYAPQAALTNTLLSACRLELSRPDDLKQDFGALHGLLGRMPEAVLKPGWPEEIQRIITITCQFLWRWRRIYTPTLATKSPII